MPSDCLFRYTAFGLEIASSHPIATLSRSRQNNLGSAEPQVCIKRVGPEISHDTPDFPHSFANWRAGPGRLLLRVDGIAEFLVEDGKTITIKAAGDADDDVVSSFLTGSAFAALLQQRQFLTIHSSAVMTDAGAVMFVGRSGVGKSTTLAALYARGYAMVTDDVAAIQFDANGRAQITPSFLGGRVTGQTLEKIGHDRSDYPRLKGEVEKYAFPMELTAEPRPDIAMIIVLDVTKEAGLTVEKLMAPEAFQILARFTFRKRFYDGMAMQGFHFDAVSKLVRSCPVIRINRPDQPFLLEELVGTVEAQIADLKTAASQVQ